MRVCMHAYMHFRNRSPRLLTYYLIFLNTHPGFVLLPFFCRDLSARRGLHGALLQDSSPAGSSWLFSSEEEGGGAEEEGCGEGLKLLPRGQGKGGGGLVLSSQARSRLPSGTCIHD